MTHCILRNFAVSANLRMMSDVSETAAAPAEGLRERKKRATRKALHRAALEATLDRGLSQVTVEEIAAAAEVSERTFFNYFSSKEEAVIGLDPARADRLREAVLARPAEEAPVAALRAVFLDLAREINDDARQEWSDRFAAIHQNPELVAAHLAAWSRNERAIAEAIAERTGLDAETDLYPGLVACTVADANRIASLTWKSSAGRDLPDLVAEAIDLLGDGLPPPRGTAPTTS